MLRKLLGTGLLLATLAGCTKLEGRTCTTNEDCGTEGVCDTAQGICYAADIEDTDGGTCSPACAEYEACTRNGCRPRFTGLNILSPANNAVLTGSTDGGVDGGAVEVKAELVVNPLYASTTQFPASLSFSATQSSGGAAGTFGTVTHTDGIYSVPWTPPMIQGQVALTVAHPIPAVGLSSTVNVTVDSVPPTFDITFSAPPVRATGNVTTADQRDTTTGFDTAFRRDESVTVTVSANETVASVALTVTGIGPGGTPGQTQTLTLAPAGSCGASPYCGTVTVDLSTLDMRAFRGTMVFRVEGQDGAGNRGTDSADLPVTRWKWAYDGNGPIAGTPAVGARGTIYFGTNLSTGQGKMFALNPDGSRKWEAATGDASGSPAVGAFTSGEEYVYTPGKTPTGPALYALRGTDGTEKGKCPYANATEVPGALAVGATPVTIGTAETGLAIYSGSPVRIAGIRPDAVLADICMEVSGTGGSAIPVSGPASALVMKDQNIYYATSTSGPGPRVTSYDLASGSNSPRTGFPQVTNYPTRGIAFANNKIYAAEGSTDNASQGSVFSIATTGGAIVPVYPATPSSRVFNFAVGTGDVAYFGAETATAAELVSVPLATPTSPTKQSGVDTLRGAPVIGKNDRLYTVNALGRVSAWVASTLAPLWNVDTNLDLSAAFTSPTLDCRRDAGGAGVAGATTGTLYFVGTTKLYAFIVDSPGLENAPWPKFQHDARNTGNPATPVTNCP